MTIRRTKIVATIGPASWDPASLERLVRAGVDVLRINFSHADRERFAAVISTARELAARLDRPIAVMGDLQGPKIRTGKLRGGGPVTLAAGRECTITTEPVEGSAELLSTTYAGLPGDVRPGQQILVSDGAIVLEVTGVAGNRVRCRVVVGGRLAEHQGINLPGADVSAPSLTQKDLADLQFCLERKVDFVALSFVRRPQDILDLRARIRAGGAEIPIVAKIEKPEALRHIHDIVRETDAVMVARGDLGVEMPPENVPLEQKKLIALCNSAGKPVVTATQMLESMIRNPRPTRAEASDVANAIFDGTDAVMLSAETAVGAYAVPAVETMARIAAAVEDASFGESRRPGLRPEWRRHYDLDVEAPAAPATIEAAAADAAVNAACDISAAAIVVYTISGSTALQIARRRPPSRILALTPTPEVYNRLALAWGVEAVRAPFAEQTDQMLLAGEEALLAAGRLHAGDMVVIVSGAMPRRGSTNFVKIQRLGG